MTTTMTQSMAHCVREPTTTTTTTTTTTNDGPLPQVITIRMLMSGKEVGSIIGRGGQIVKSYREKSGARINISDGSCPERIVTVTGTVEQIYQAFLMMCQKFENDFIESLSKLETSEEISCPPVTFRILIPTIQCGSIIGKGGCQIKVIRELTGASVQVASEALPYSSERSVTVSGAAKAVARCIKTLSEILLESPPRGVVVPYRSKFAGGTSSTAAVAASAAATSTGAPSNTNTVLVNNISSSPSVVASAGCTNSTVMQSSPNVMVPAEFNTSVLPNAGFHPQTLSSANLPLFNCPFPTAISGPFPYLTHGVLSTLPTNPFMTAQYVPLHHGSIPMPEGIKNGTFTLPNGVTCSPNQMVAPTVSMYESNSTMSTMDSAMNNGHCPTTTATIPVTIEIVVPNDLVGCIIGRGGSKICEIRTTSKAQIKISNSAENSRDRKITISGESQQVAAARYLINNSLELHKHVQALNSVMRSHLTSQDSLPPVASAWPLSSASSNISLGSLLPSAAAIAAAAAASTNNFFDVYGNGNLGGRGKLLIPSTVFSSATGAADPGSLVFPSLFCSSDSGSSSSLLPPTVAAAGGGGGGGGGVSSLPTNPPKMMVSQVQLNGQRRSPPTRYTPY